MATFSNSDFFARYVENADIPQIEPSDWQNISENSCFPLAWGSHEVYDFTQGYDPHRKLNSQYGVGRYNEVRPTMYTTSQFSEEVRNIHIGLDLASPENSPVMSVLPGVLFMAAYNSSPFDYGGTIILKHKFKHSSFFTLYGHLSKRSVIEAEIGRELESGTVIGELGNIHENGGWNPHLHLQISMLKPKACDLPGVVSDKYLAESLLLFPDPQLIIGRLY